MVQQQHSLTSVSDIIDTTMLPDPTIPIPFEKFAALKDSDDMLMRAAFWCFYAAWQNDKAVTTAPVAISVEARHDGHQLRAVTQQLAIRDAVLITRHDLNVLQHPSRMPIRVCIVLAFLLGVVVMLWIMSGPW
jgi:hypothetical protein